MNSKIVLFSICNFILAGMNALWFLLWLFVILAGIFDDTTAYSSEELIYTVTFFALICLFYFSASIFHLIAGIGLLQSKKWGYVFHLIATGLVSANPGCCYLGLFYSIPTFIICAQKDFQQIFHLKGKIDKNKEQEPT